MGKYADVSMYTLGCFHATPIISCVQGKPMCPQMMEREGNLRAISSMY